MEATKNHNLKKRKKKKQQLDAHKITVIKPELFDGMTNWLNLQKVENLLLHTSQLFLQTLQPLLRFLCDFLTLCSGQVLCLLSRVSLQVLGVVEKEKAPANPFASQTRRSFSKKKQPGKTKNKAPFSRSLPKATHKFDFSERRSAIVDFQRKGAVSSSTGNSESKISDNEMSDQETEDKESKQLTKVLAMDCEMVGTGPDGADSILARVSIVNSHGECVYDTFVAPKEKVTDYRTEVSGVRPSDLKNGKDLFDVQKEVLDIIDGRRIVGHDLKHDFDALFISHPHTLIRDTAKYKPFRDVSGGRTPSLKKLTAVLLGCDIQSGEHNSIEDAQAAMLLYLKHKSEWEKFLKSLRKKRQPRK